MMIIPAFIASLCLLPWLWLVLWLVVVSNPAYVLNLIALVVMLRAMEMISFPDSGESNNTPSGHTPEVSDNPGMDAAVVCLVTGQMKNISSDLSDGTSEGADDIAPEIELMTVTEPGEGPQSFEPAGQSEPPFADNVLMSPADMPLSEEHCGPLDASTSGLDVLVKVPETEDLPHAQGAAGGLMKPPTNRRVKDEARPKFINTYLVSAAEGDHPLPSPEFFYNYRFFYYRHRGNWREMRGKMKVPTLDAIAEDSRPVAAVPGADDIPPMDAGRKSKKGVKKMLRGVKKTFKKMRSCF